MSIINEFGIELLKLWIDIYFINYKLWGAVCGISLLGMAFLCNTKYWTYLIVPALLSLMIPLPLIIALPEMSFSLTGRSVYLPTEHMYWLLAGIFIPPLAFVFFGGIGAKNNRRTDIRYVTDDLPGKLQYAYDPEKYFRLNHGVFFGLDQQKRPLYVPLDEWRSSHIQIIGTTGSGKGVAAGVLLTQALQQGEAVVIIDPKADEYLPIVMMSTAKKAGIPFVYLDLTAQKAQWNPFWAKSEQDIEELLTAGLSMGDTGSDADVYRSDDRRVARQFAAFCSRYQKPIHLCFSDFFKVNSDLIVSSRKLFADLEELVFTPCVQASTGVELSALLESGAVVYVRGSTRNARIIKLQKIFLLSCMQLIEARDRATARHVALFLDEFKYMLSKSAVEALGVIRDKRAHILVAHQALGDLEDCGKDLNVKAVTGAVIENCAIKLSYKVRDPDTALWLSKLSGTILVDDEIRTLEGTLGLTEKPAKRTIRHVERSLVDINQLLMLPKKTAVLFGVGHARFIYTSPIRVDKSAFKIEPQGEDVHSFKDDGQLLPGSLVDVD